MQPPYNDRWERSKRYLLRNFLVNPGFQLSPIPEERSSPDSGSLPDLIVEPEPDRHDHPPAFYVGLERRMKRYYRQLFLGEKGSDDEDSSDFEVNRSMASTFMIDADTRKEYIENVTSDENGSELDVSQIKEKPVNKSADKSDKFNASIRADTNGNKLIDTCASSVSEDSNQHCHIISTTIAEIHEPKMRAGCMTDDGSPELIPRLLQFGRIVFGDVTRFSGQSISVLDTSDQKKSHLSSYDVTIEDPEADVQRLLTDSELTRISLDSDKIFNTEIVGKLIETGKSPERGVDSSHEITTEDRIQVSDLECDKVLVEVETDQQDKTSEITDIQNTSIDWNKDGIDEDEECFDNAVRKGVFASKARIFIAQTSDEESFENTEPIAHSSGKSFNDDSVEVMREGQESHVNESWHGEVDHASPALGFEPKTSLDKLENVSTDSNEINASLDEIENEISNEETENELTNEGTENEMTNEEIENEMSNEESENAMATDEEEYNTPDQHDNARIIEDFWSVSPIEVNFEKSLTGETSSSSNKRKAVMNNEISMCKKKKKDIAIQTSSNEGPRKREDVRMDFLLGDPLVFRLCHCQDHVCP